MCLKNNHNYYRPRQAFLMTPRNITLIILVLIPLLGGYQFIVSYIQPSPTRDLPQSVINALQVDYNTSIDEIIGILFLFKVSQIFVLGNSVQDYSNGVVTLSQNGYQFGCLLFGPSMVFFSIMLLCAFKTHKTVVVSARKGSQQRFRKRRLL